MNGFEERGKWLENLKPGDHVCYGTGWSSTIVLDRVERITSTLFILARNGTRVRRRDGHECGSGYARVYIQPVTADVLNDIAEQRIRAKARGIDWHKLPTDKLRRILAIVEEPE